MHVVASPATAERPIEVAPSVLPAGFASIGTAPNGLSVSLVFGAIAFAGSGGAQNLCQSNWIRDKGFGMGAKVGAMIGGLTYGARKDAAMKNYQTALKLNPDSAIARIEYANGLVMLEGNKALKQAEQLYAEAAACEPLDAMEKLDVEQAKAEMED